MMWVIDTSAMFRLYVPDGPLHPEVETAFNRAASGAELVLVPQWLMAERATDNQRRRFGQSGTPSWIDVMVGGIRVPSPAWLGVLDGMR